MTTTLDNFFSPRGVALIGASPNPTKLSYGVLRNLTEYGYQGLLYPVNPNYPEVCNLTCYPDIAAVPDPVDLAVILLPAKLVPEILEACGRRGLKAAIIISGGFKEVGPDGALLEAECLTIARRYGLRLLGPNCVGTLNPQNGLNTTFISGMPQPGRIGFLSQSGGVCGGIIDYVIGKRIGFSRFVSLGNEADVSETDLIDYLGQEPHTAVIAAYVEAIRDGCRFMAVSQQVTRRKPIVLLKAGRTAAGGRAVSSHTGAMAGSNDAYEAAFKQCGVIQAVSIPELFDISLALATQPLPAGNRVFVLSNSGGPAALAADNLAAQRLALPDLTPATKSRLQSRLDPVIQLANPMDMLGGAGPDEYEFTLPVILADPNVEAVLVIVVPHRLLDPTEAAHKICRAANGATKPVLTCFLGDHSVNEARQILHRHSIPMYPFPETACRALSALVHYAGWRNHNHSEPPPQFEVNRRVVARLLANANSNRTLGEAAVRPILAAYGIPVIPGQVAHNPHEAVDIANKLGYPVALKIVSPDIFHKSDAGGIELDLAGPPAVAVAYGHMLAMAGQARMEGALVEAMAPSGTEVIVGMRRDPQFGPLIMFGLGGIYVELWADVSFRVAPLNRQEALALIHETRAGRLLAGLRGRGRSDIEAVADCILRLSQLALDFPQIEEVEINPLLVLAGGEGVMALDGRMLLALH